MAWWKCSPRVWQLVEQMPKTIYLSSSLESFEYLLSNNVASLKPWFYLFNDMYRLKFTSHFKSLNVSLSPILLNIDRWGQIVGVPHLCRSILHYYKLSFQISAEDAMLLKTATLHQIQITQDEVSTKLAVLSPFRAETATVWKGKRRTDAKRMENGTSTKTPNVSWVRKIFTLSVPHTYTLHISESVPDIRQLADQFDETFLKCLKYKDESGHRCLSALARWLVQNPFRNNSCGGRTNFESMTLWVTEVEKVWH